MLPTGYSCTPAQAKRQVVTLTPMDPAKVNAMKRLRLWAAAVLTLWFSLGVFAPAVAGWPSPTPLSLHVLKDTWGRESIETVTAASRWKDFKPVQGSFADGFTRSVYWFRVEVHAPDVATQILPSRLLEVRPTYLDDVRFYLPDRGRPGHYTEHRHGDRLPFSQREVATRTLVQTVVFRDAAPQIIYVRLQTTSSAVFTLQAWRPADFLVAATAEYALLGILVGGYLFALIANLPGLLRRQDALAFYFSAYVLSGLMVLVFVQGLGAQFLLPQMPSLADPLVPIGSILLTLTATAFYRIALQVDRWSPWANRFYFAVIALTCVSLPAPFLGYYDKVAQWLFISVLMVLAVGSLRCLQLWRDEEPDARLLLMAHLITLVGALPSVLALLGWVSGDFLVVYVYQAGILGSVLAVQITLKRRNQRLEVLLLTSQQEQVRVQAVADEQHAVAEQRRRFIDMITHELKTPLSVIRMRLGLSSPSAAIDNHARQAVHDMDAVIDRIAQLGRLEDGAAQVKSSVCDMAQMVDECLAAQPEFRRRCQRVWQVDCNPLVQADPVLLRTVLTNLLDNACKYSPAGSRVLLDCADQPRGGRSGLLMRVSNAAGPAGRPDPKHLFEKYYRAPGARQHVGSGLGLHIVRNLCASMGASLDYKAQEPEIVFELWLPR